MTAWTPISLRTADYISIVQRRTHSDPVRTEDDIRLNDIPVPESDLACLWIDTLGDVVDDDPARLPVPIRSCGFA
jgi:hypothetical protein